MQQNKTMNNSTEKITLQFGLSDKKIADIIASSQPPDGITAGKTSVITKAGAGSGGVFAQIAIQFIHDISIGVLVTWICDCCIKSGKKKSRVNGEKIVFNKRTILRLIKIELKNQVGREKQGRDDKNRTPKKRL